MTKRAILIGLLAAVFMGAFGQYASKYIPGTWGLIRGHLPVSVFGFLIFFVMVVNPLLGLIRASWRLQAGETALIAGLLLVGCGVVDAGMMRYYPRQLITPIRQEQIKPGWRETEILKYTPPSMLANNGEYDEAVMDGFFSASGEPDSIFPFSEVPWHAWWRPLTVWTSLIALFLLANICLAVVVHRQWADRERLRYPLAEIASSLLRKGPDGGTAILRNRIFWIGMAVPFAIRMINYIQVWVPNSIEIPLTFDLSALNDAFPEFMQTPGASHFTRLALVPTCIGLSFLLASDIGLSIGLTSGFSVLVMYYMIGFGVNLSGSDMQGGYRQWQTFGAFLAMATMIVYVGRRYYWHTAKEAVTFVRQKETHPSGVWGLRLFLVCMAGSVAILTAVGMDMSIALPAWILMIMMVLVCARLNAEAGTFVLEPGWHVPGILLGLFGLSALGPTIIIVLGMMVYLVQVEVIESMMPFVVNGLKMSTDAAQKAGRVGLVFGVGLLLTIAVAVPTALWADYHHPAAVRRGGDGADIWETAQRSVSELTLTGELESAAQSNGVARWLRMRPDRRFVAGVGIGFFALIALSALRLRFPWWPFHPVMILLFGTRFAGRFGFSFLVGWLIKMAVTKFGGGQKYIQIKPGMIGVIVGDLAGGFAMMATNWIYYGISGTLAPDFWRTVLW